MPDNVIKTDIQDYWRRSYVGGKEIPSSNVEQVKVYETSEYTSGKTYHTEGAVGAVIGQVDASSPQFYCLKIEGIEEGDKLFVHGRSFTDRDLIAFADKDSKKISVFSQYGTAGDVYATAPKNANIAYLNSFKDADFSVTYTKVSSRLYAGDKEVDIMYAGDKVAYAKHKENIIGEIYTATGSYISINRNNNSAKFIKNGGDYCISLPLNENCETKDNLVFSFDVTDFSVLQGGNVKGYIYNFFGGNVTDAPIVISGVGHYSFKFNPSAAKIKNERVALQFRYWLNCDDGDYFIIKNIKLEHNIVDTGYSLAPSVTPQNRVKIGKHWYNTCTIGSQEWLSENLNEDLKDVVVKDVDWASYKTRSRYINVRDNTYHVGDTLNESIATNASFDLLELNVSGGETIRSNVSRQMSTTLYAFVVVDSNNKIVYLGKQFTTDKTFVIPEGGVKLYINAYKENVFDTTFISVIQSTHTSEGTWEGYYNNDASYGVKGYGKLYTWDCLCSANETPSAAMVALLKDGWRVPTKDDLLALSQVSGITASKIKEKWTWGGTNVGTNELGFSAMSCGYRMSADGAFSSIDTRCIIHSSSVSTTNSAFTVDLSIREATALYNDESSKNLCRSIRLVRDVPVTLSAPPTTGSAYVASVDGNVGWVSE